MEIKLNKSEYDEILLNNKIVIAKGEKNKNIAIANINLYGQKEADPAIKESNIVIYLDLDNVIVCENEISYNAIICVRSNSINIKTVQKGVKILLLPDNTEQYKDLIEYVNKKDSDLFSLPSSNLFNRDDFYNKYLHDYYDSMYKDIGTVGSVNQYVDSILPDIEEMLLDCGVEISSLRNKVDLLYMDKDISIAENELRFINRPIPEATMLKIYQNLMIDKRLVNENKKQRINIITNLKNMLSSRAFGGYFVDDLIDHGAMGIFGRLILAILSDTNISFLADKFNKTVYMIYKAKTILEGTEEEGYDL